MVGPCYTSALQKSSRSGVGLGVCDLGLGRGLGCLRAVLRCAAAVPPVTGCRTAARGSVTGAAALGSGGCAVVLCGRTCVARCFSVGTRAAVLGGAGGGGPALESTGAPGRRRGLLRSEVKMQALGQVPLVPPPSPPYVFPCANPPSLPRRRRRRGFADRSPAIFPLGAAVQRAVLRVCGQIFGAFLGQGLGQKPGLHEGEDAGATTGGGGGFRARGNMNLQILARQSLCHLLKMSEQIMYGSQ